MEKGFLNINSASKRIKSVGKSLQNDGDVSRTSVNSAPNGNIPTPISVSCTPLNEEVVTNLNQGPIITD